MIKYIIVGILAAIIFASIVIYIKKLNQDKKNRIQSDCWKQCYGIDKKSFDECANKCKQ